MSEKWEVEFAFSATDPSVERTALHFIRKGLVTIAGPLKQTDAIRIIEERNALQSQVSSLKGVVGKYHSLTVALAEALGAYHKSDEHKCWTGDYCEAYSTILLAQKTLLDTGETGKEKV